MTTPLPAKFSRYRSVRKAHVKNVAETTPPVPQNQENEVGLSRTPSRYHRSGRQISDQVPPLPDLSVTCKAPYSTQQLHLVAPQRDRQLSQDDTRPISDLLASDDPIQQTQRSAKRLADAELETFGVKSQTSSKGRASRTEQRVNKPISTSSRRDVAVSRSHEAAREEALMMLEGEFDRTQQAKGRKERSRSFVRNDQVVIADTRDSSNALARHDTKKFKDVPKPTSGLDMQKSLAKDVVPLQNQVYATRQSPNATQSPTEQSVDFDAPVSAINAGRRKVQVRMRGISSETTLFVTPDATVQDLLHSASTRVSKSFDPRSAILIESFASMGLERPLRRYEHIRDVMNSWDTDDQNHFVVVVSESTFCDKLLEQREAPASQPAELSLRLSHSQRPGKWEKKWVTMRTDGQVTISKHEKDDEATKICNLSDFDIYTPTLKQVKKFNSPKKVCLAVKSQQKPAFFLEGSNFVHFFATNNKEIADLWYEAVQSWRSWYLTSVLGKGAQDTTRNGKAGGTAQESVTYQIGTFKPLVDLNSLNLGSSLDMERSGHVLDSQSHQSSTLPHREAKRIGVGIDGRRSSQTRGPPSTFHTKLVTEVRNKIDPGLDTDSQAFTGTGLLARSTSRRSQGRKTTGHGIQSSKDKPLISLEAENEFAEGSLLRNLQSRSTN